MSVEKFNLIGATAKWSTLTNCFSTNLHRTFLFKIRTVKKMRTAENHAPAAYAASTLYSQLLVQDLVGVREPPLLAVAQPGGVANEPRPTLSAQNTGGLVCSSRGGSNCS